MPADKHDPDDIFAESRMSFGDHIEELRTRLLKALKALMFFLVIGFALDGIGAMMEWENFGVGRPVFNLMTQTVEDQVRDFYNRRNEKVWKKLPQFERLSVEEAERIQKLLDENSGSLEMLSSEDRSKLLGKTEPLTVFVPVDEVEKSLGQSVPPEWRGKELPLKARVYPAELNYLNMKGESLTKTRKYLTSLSVTEPMIVYFKVSLICGVVIASPWIFYQIWAFVAAGLYPHEKRHVHFYLPFSLSLFLSGVILCQFLVLPSAVRALLGFNSFLDVDPDIRLNEWLGFAILLPLVFGISFQTPLVMVFLNRIGTFSYKDYLAYWRGAVMVLMFVSALLTPTPDAITMMYLFVPMFSLYMLGVLICKYFPPSHEQFIDEDSDQVAV